MIETTTDTRTTVWTTCESPLGTLTLAGTRAGDVLQQGARAGDVPQRGARASDVLGQGTRAGDVLQRVYFPSEPHSLAREARDPTALAEARIQLEQYFAGERRAFELELEPHGGELQRRVWDALRRIPYGETTTYGAIARELGVLRTSIDPPARIVGAAIARTPIPIVIPCHRVVAADGALTGYRGGLEVKRALLDFEATGGLLAALAEGWERDQLSLL
jgi:methylated-DNA-[protein]-cysteine S-methyltransferase